VRDERKGTLPRRHHVVAVCGEVVGVSRVAGHGDDGRGQRVDDVVHDFGAGCGEPLPVEHKELSVRRRHGDAVVPVAKRVAQDDRRHVQVRAVDVPKLDGLLVHARAVGL